MVNHGVSRACQTCRQRRKKCDETRPICNRCVRSKRTCLGYKDESELVFRNYGVSTNEAHPGLSGNQSHSSAPAGITTEIGIDIQIEEYALTTFFHDYCVESADRRLSRGFLDGLRSVILHAGESSDVAVAAKIIALTTAGNRMGRASLIDRANVLYGFLLRSFQVTLSSDVACKTVESLMTAVLLGLYEIIRGTGESPGQHVAHVRGVGALLNGEKSPFDLRTGTDLFQLGNPLQIREPLKQPEAPGVLCAPMMHGSIQSLDAILIKFNPLFHRANALLSDASLKLVDVESLMQDAVSLDEDFSAWAQSQVGEWKPRKLGTITAQQADSIYCWPGDVEVYFDLYVAAVWNTYRKTHLMALDFIVKCSGHLQKQDVGKKAQYKAQELAEGIAASVAYHLTLDPESYIQAPSKPIVPGRPVGGLLLLHPLYVVTRAPVVSPRLRAQMSKCLAWIGKNMGIGQATLLSNLTSPLPFNYMAEGHTLIWAGMLIQPI